MKTKWAGRRPSSNVFRRAWDTEALRANAQTVLTALAPLADADPHSADPEERRRADLTPPAALLNHWRIVRLCRRYREVAWVVDKIKSPALADCHRYTHTLPTVAASPDAEATAERAERRRRDRPFPALSLIACELHAIDRRVYGEISLQAEREGEAASRLSRYRLKRPKTGRSAPDSPYVRIQRYPRRRAIRAWIKFCQADMYLLCYGTPNPNKRRDDEIVTAADRERRYQKRVRKAIIRAATGIAQTAEGLTALEKILAAARERMGMAS